jgi:hypothetical protein
MAWPACSCTRGALVRFLRRPEAEITALAYVPLAALLTGIVITFVLTMYLSTLIGRTARVEQLVDERAAQLRRATPAAEPPDSDLLSFKKSVMLT